MRGEKVAQKLYCPVCHNLLIKNDDLVIDKPVIMDIDKVVNTEKEVKTIVCHKCKRRIRYYIEETNEQ